MRDVNKMPIFLMAARACNIVISGFHLACPGLHEYSRLSLGLCKPARLCPQSSCCSQIYSSAQYKILITSLPFF